MTPLTYRFPRNPQNGCRRLAVAPRARVSQRGFGLSDNGAAFGCQPARDEQFHAGFMIEVCTL
jgi:hypothetical protein